jgi:hypothetical protein
MNQARLLANKTAERGWAWARNESCVPHWQRVAKLILAKEDVLTVSRALELALFMDAKLGRGQPMIQFSRLISCNSGIQITP